MSGRRPESGWTPPGAGGTMIAMSSPPRPAPSRSASATRLGLACLPLVALALAAPREGGQLGRGDRDASERHEAGFDTITDDEVRAHVNLLAHPSLRGRDTPSAGLDRAEAYVAEQLTAYGFEGLGPEGSFLLPWTYPRPLEAPVRDGCALEVTTPDGATRSLEVGVDWVPFPGANGTAAGELVFLGHGVRDKKERYDDLKGPRLKGKVALVLTEEPRHKKRFEGPDEVTPAASAWAKLEDLEDEGLVGAILVRRPGPVVAVDDDNDLLEGDELEDLEPLTPAALGFHHTWPLWNDPDQDRRGRAALPAIEVTPLVASELLGTDVLELAARMDKSGRPLRQDLDGLEVAFEATTEERTMSADNVVGLLPGSDPALAEEVVVLGAHLDHLGTDARGRIACGADDNASGVAAMLEVAQALAEARPRRSVLVCAFSGEEDGLLGSRAFCEDPPVAVGAMVAMLNLDMIGRGPDSSAIVLGVDNNKDLGKVLKEAQRLEKTGIKKAITNRGQELWRRSDHASFHDVGVPVLFFFEHVPISENEDYHTWRDVPALLSYPKIGNTARLAFNTAWLLAQDDDRPAEPRR